MPDKYLTSHPRKQLKSLPHKPGIYVFRDADGKPLYVGKAKDLRRRVASYFGSGVDQGGPRIRRMLKRMRDFDFVVTGSETEALLLEDNFIKRHRPPFNVMMRDDKSYPYVAVTVNEEFPRVMITRKPHRPGVNYYGPFTGAGRVREIMDLLGRIFPYRKCRGPRPGRRSGSPCLNYHIGLCLAPCVGKVDSETYRAIIDRVEQVLQGRTDGLEDELSREMQEAAARQRFEEAAVLRNRLHALKHLLEHQQASAIGLDSLDVIAISVEDDLASIQLLQVRDGLLSDRRSFYLKNASGEPEEAVLEQFIIHYYSTPIGIPAEVVVPPGFADTGYLADFLSRRKGSRAEVRPARRQKRRDLYDMAYRNAVLALRQEQLRAEERRDRPLKALTGLKEALRLPRRPLRIECFDVSNTNGEYPVASMVVFSEGLPRPELYRKFAIRGTAGPDDFAMLAEAVSRRFSGRDDGDGDDESFTVHPDLVMVDGGAGQVSAVSGALAALGVKVPVIGLAKRFEDIYRTAQLRPLRLADDSPALLLLRRIRDEAHRFAIAYHRQRRGRQVSSSILDGIPGIGPARKKAILRHFGSPERFLVAGRDELETVPGLPAKVAREVHAYVHKLGQI